MTRPLVRDVLEDALRPRTSFGWWLAFFRLSRSRTPDDHARKWTKRLRAGEVVRTRDVGRELEAECEGMLDHIQPNKEEA